MFGTIGAVGLLFSCGVCDIRWKKIPVMLLAAGGIWAFIWMLIKAGGQGVVSTLSASLLALLPGAFLLVLSYLTEKKVGAGDGILLMVLGVLEGGSTVLLVFCVGLFLQSLLAVGLLIFKKADKQTCIPFVPFLLAARLILFWT